MVGLVLVDVLVDFGELHAKVAQFLVVPNGVFRCLALVTDYAQQGFFIK